jgi:hypothetical protein
MPCIDAGAGFLSDSPRQRIHSEDNDMLVTFTSKAYADITMFGDVAVTLLKMMGHSGTVPGAILAADLPAALSRLTAAIDKTRTETSAGDDDEDETRVSLSNRALPLVDLLTAAVQQNGDVMWE